jgi:hypothetical protein
LNNSLDCRRSASIPSTSSRRPCGASAVPPPPLPGPSRSISNRRHPAVVRSPEPTVTSTTYLHPQPPAPHQGASSPHPLQDLKPWPPCPVPFTWCAPTCWSPCWPVICKGTWREDSRPRFPTTKSPAERLARVRSLHRRNAPCHPIHLHPPVSAARQRTDQTGGSP